jgi:hypothetical protein
MQLSPMELAVPEMKAYDREAALQSQISDMMCPKCHTCRVCCVCKLVSESSSPKRASMLAVAACRGRGSSS